MSSTQEQHVEASGGDMSYPSPGAETLDAGPFYHTAPRDGAQDQEQVEHEVHEPTHDHTLLKEHEHDQNDLPVIEPATPQHASRQPNLEELQLAAQLGQGLAGTPLIPATDPNMNVEDPNLRNMMPHHEPEQQHTPSYMHDTPTSESMLPHGLAVGIGGGPLPPHYNLGDGVPPRKRSKVSRACDECRRKKIKCDAQSDTGDVPCSSCSRSAIKCLFSRIPQKRGPSKGYIKELADRIHSIEHKLETEGMSHEDLDGLLGAERSRLSNLTKDSRKRPFSSISSGDFNVTGSARQPGWDADPRPGHPAAPLENQTTPYTSTSLVPPQHLDPKTSIASLDIGLLETEDQPSTLQPKDQSNTIDTEHHVNRIETEIQPDLEEGLLQESVTSFPLRHARANKSSYLATVQTVYPILPHNYSRLQMLLAGCPPSVQTSFVHALLAVAQSSSGDVGLASKLLREWEDGQSPRTLSIDIVHAQALLLLTIDADWRGSSTFPGLLARAVTLARKMQLWRYNPVAPVEDVDSDDNLCIRIWWSLVLMERWHAIGTGVPILLPEAIVKKAPALEPLVGDVCYHLIRLSKFLGRVSQFMSLTPTGDVHDWALYNLDCDIDEYRVDLPEHIEPATHPLVHLAYWHCRLLVYLLTPKASSTQILWPTKELIRLLSNNSDIRSPLARHFSSLVAQSLSRLCRMESSSEQAVQLAQEILDKPGGVWDGIRDKLTDRVRPASSAETIASHGLQHLADLATAGDGTALDGTPIPSLAQGYLEFF